jgi:hypothetical protein
VSDFAETLLCALTLMNTAIVLLHKVTLLFVVLEWAKY